MDEESLQSSRCSLESSRDVIPSRPGTCIPFGSSSPYVFKLDPPTGFSDSIELSEAECDRPSKLSAYRSPRKSNTSRDFTIAV
ncbi:hypothetical protein RUM44_006499 [Polyplax serrata]|uniref:Uncharacterized protein n=1 Tax=Polyplax serrata TaxID=468196 RepID=A0ABR1AI90_POLSC